MSGQGGVGARRRAVGGSCGTQAAGGVGLGVGSGLAQGQVLKEPGSRKVPGHKGNSRRASGTCTETPDHEQRAGRVPAGRRWELVNP